MKYTGFVWVLTCCLLVVLVGCGDTDEAESGDSTSNGSTATSNGATSNGTTSNGTTGASSNGMGADAGTPDTDMAEDTGMAGEDVLPEETGVENVPFDMVFSMAFEANGCNGGYCHGSGQGGLMLVGASDTHESLVNVEAVAPMCGLTQLVVPGEPEQSLLWLRVRPIALDEGEPCVPKMPQGSDGLSDEQAQLVYDWILAGAPQ